MHRPDMPVILIIDDEKDIRDGCERILTRMDCCVHKAENGDTALTLLPAITPAVVLLDLKMPGMEGMDVMGHIHDIDASIPVIIITGFATLDTAVEAMKLGAYDFIPKPFEPDQLRIVVTRALEKRRLTIETRLLEEARRQTLADLNAEKSRIRTIIDALPHGVVITNAAGRVVLSNPSFRREFGCSYIPQETPIGKCMEDPDLAEFIRHLSEPNQDEPLTSSLTYDCNLSENRYLLARGEPVTNAGGEYIGAVVIFTDVTAIQELSHLKSEFVEMVSHELRSPLATIHEQLALVVSSTDSQLHADDQRVLTRTMERTDALIRLIGDLLDLSRIEAGTSGREPRTIHVEKIIEDLVEFHRIRAVGKKQALTLNSSCKPLQPLWTDPRDIDGIFGNLISNAIKYTPDGGRITVDIYDEGSGIRVSVQDSGFGMSPEQCKRIFDKFYRIKNDQTRRITGTGLGLPIVKHLVDELHGTINVTSSPGQGSDFTVFLPYPGNT